MAHILVVDDEEKMRHLLSIMLGREGHKVDQAGDGLEALEKLNSIPFDMVITDIKMPRMDGIELLKNILEMDMPCPVVFITAFATIESAVEAMRQGAADYITKPFETDRILLTVERTLNLSRIMVENRNLKRELQESAGAHEIIYSSKKMAETIDLAAKVALGDSAVFISGESGTGKELLARYIHHASPRKGGRFVPVNCAAISPNLVESELFGHERGAFTGATQRNIGKFEYSSDGTLFLDEIGDLSFEAQSKLLRALQEKKIQRVGGNKEIPVNVRILCATNRDLNELVEKGDFRNDLFFRINVFPIVIAPLRERKDDIVPLSRHFIRCIVGGGDIQLTDGAVRTLMEHKWPGNVRELANAVERAFIVGRDQGAITAETLSFLRNSPSSRKKDINFQLSANGISLDTLEKNLVIQALELTGNNQTSAAGLLGLTRARFRVLMKQVKKKG